MGVVVPFPCRYTSRLKTMADSLPMMPWFPRDFLASTLGWSMAEQGLYRRLLDAQWEFGSLPNNDAKLRRIAQATEEEFAEAWPCVCQKFAIGEDGRLRNRRLEEHRAKAFSIRESRSKAGRNGGIAKALANAKQNASNSDSKPLAPSPSPSEEKIKNPAARAADPDSDLDPEAYLIWNAGVDLVGESKRGLLGKLVKQHGQGVVASKIAELMAMPEKPRDPASYLVGALRKQERRFVC
jgi:uncharacterized protein YdaU (DUF1376 family)